MIRSAFSVRIFHLAVHSFLSLTKITFVCLADWGSASDTLTDTLSDTLSFSPLNIALVVNFFVSLRSRSFVERIGDQQVSY